MQAANHTAPSPNSMRLASRIVIILSLAVPPLGAALAFVLQPMAGKALLPRLGGTSASWLGACLFFQAALVLGYVWGLWVSKLHPSRQLLAQASLGVVAVIAFHAPRGFYGAPTLGGVMSSLALSCLPAMVLLFGLSPWVHSWRERLGHPEPYAVYAISNVGSLAALLLYPFLIEPQTGLTDQFAVWHGLFAMLAALIAAGAWGLWATARSLPAQPQAYDEQSSRPSLGLIPLWLGLAALGTLTMLGATQLVVDEIGSGPIAWVGPLGVYLAAFALVFCGRWRDWMTGTAVVALALAITGYMTTRGFGASTMDGIRVVALLAAAGAAALVSTALLHATRPERGGAWFYLALGVGGAGGGMLALWAVPALLPRPVEFPLLAAATLACGLFWASRWKHAGAAAACAAVAIGPVLLLGIPQALDDRMGDSKITHYRDLHGHLMIKTDDRSVVLSSATTTHGSQLTESAESRQRPTLYYTESSAVGCALQGLQAKKASIRVAIVGLGAGTLASYARESDEFVFIDVDPKIESVARRHFTYLADAKGKIEIRLADGRAALTDTHEDFDLIVIDAFMGDGVPPHLLTFEALAQYQARIAKHDGLILVHATMRYSNLFPIMAATARSLGLEALGVTTEIDDSLPHRD